MQKYNNDSRTRNVENSLKRLLQKYNNFLINDRKAASNYNLKSDSLYFIPNNGLKFYCFISNRPNHSSNILQFFSKTPIDTFFIEIENMFDKQVILEGYMYTTPMNKKEYCVTDILVYNDNVVNVLYKNRLKLLYDLFDKKTLLGFVNLNDYLTFYIHPVFNSDNKHLLDIYNVREKLFIETIDDFYKTNTRITIEEDECKVYEKIIDKGMYSDVYNVYNPTTMNNEGILYIPTINDSRRLYEMFKDKQNLKIRIKCCFNTKFKKYMLFKD